MFSLHQLIMVRIVDGDLRLKVLQRMFRWFVGGVVVVVAAAAAAAAAAYNGLELQLHTFNLHVIKSRS
jgi:hypothetical protein